MPCCGWKVSLKTGLFWYRGASGMVHGPINHVTVVQAGPCLNFVPVKERLAYATSLDMLRVV